MITDKRGSIVKTTNKTNIHMYHIKGSEKSKRMMSKKDKTQCHPQLSINELFPFMCLCMFMINGCLNIQKRPQPAFH